MMRAAALALFLVAACGTDSRAPAGGGDDTGGGDDGSGTGGDGGGPVSNATGHITSDKTWTGTVHVTGSVIVDAGVTLTIAAGTQVLVKTGATSITANGTIDIQGTSASPVTVGPEGSGHWYGFEIPQGGVLTTEYLHQLDGGIHISDTGSATILDSTMSHMNGDFLTMSDGTVDVEYSAIGVEPPATDTTHCDMHVEGAPHIKVTHSNVSTSSYGIMFYGGMGEDFTYDNWFSNANDVDVLPTPVSADFSHSYFASGQPANPHGYFTEDDMQSARVTDAGPR
ncbi:MAG TPA: hypothetical protein VGM88_00505 [Kofleriaceae bacterium]|jgi:hypothetical protein